MGQENPELSISSAWNTKESGAKALFCSEEYLGLLTMKTLL
jgi:hypothetical protein